MAAMQASSHHMCVAACAPPRIYIHAHNVRVGHTTIWLGSASTSRRSPLLEQSSGNAGPWRRQHQGLQAGVPQELPPEPEILQERRHGPAGEEARRQVVRRHRHGHHPWQRSHVAAGPPSIIIVVVVVAKEAVACCSHGEDDGEAEEGGEGVLSPEEEDEQRRDREAAGEEADQGAAGDGARRRAPQRRLAAPRGHGLRRPPARAGRRAPPRLQRHATETIVPPHGRGCCTASAIENRDDWNGSSLGWKPRVERWQQSEPPRSVCRMAKKILCCSGRHEI